VKLPPRPDLHVPARVLRDERDRRFLVFVGAVLAALALGFKSELVAPNQVWWLAAGLVLVATPALFAYLHGSDRRARLEHFIPVAIGAVVVAGLSQLVTEWWKFGLASAAFGLGFLVAAQLDYRKLRGQERSYHVVVQEALLAVPLAGAFLVVLAAPFPLALQAFWVAILALLASYRSFLVVGQPLSSRRAFLIAFFVAQVVGLAAWAISPHLQDTSQGIFAVILLLVWYINRGIFRHMFEDTLSGQVLLEYGAFAALLAYLLFISIHP
jgi:hypothetical protein